MYKIEGVETPSICEQSIAFPTDEVKAMLLELSLPWESEKAHRYADGIRDCFRMGSPRESPNSLHENELH
ncbi:hypothetical protein HPB50_017622 [Hyalomma asiaticum]|uniref:Uncharacterized protein n=1 Tax=Hyalomma asiaticum TaxID=266040 RepID=A0ACB7RRL3_HYAAI|nr:hypothetical protein HPB50_017622 [Hyalomma asiaticum]